MLKKRKINRDTESFKKEDLLFSYLLKKSYNGKVVPYSQIDLDLGISRVSEIVAKINEKAKVNLIKKVFLPNHSRRGSRKGITLTRAGIKEAKSRRNKWLTPHEENLLENTPELIERGISLAMPKVMERCSHEQDLVLYILSEVYSTLHEILAEETADYRALRQKLKEYVKEHLNHSTSKLKLIS